MKKQNYTAPSMEQMTVSVEMNFMGTLNSSAPSSNGPANIGSSDIHGDGSLW